MNPYGSAMVVLPIVAQETGVYPNRVLDVGCGDGSWLRAARNLGASCLVGIDHQPQCCVEGVTYRPMDLIAMLMSPPWALPSPQYDLAICVEVAEHLPERVAPYLVAFLANASGQVLFSAAPPGQGPYPPPDDPENEQGNWHINEQPPEYWERLFALHGLKRYDIVRPAVEGSDLVDPWYRENTFLYVRGDAGDVVKVDD